MRSLPLPAPRRARRPLAQPLNAAGTASQTALNHRRGLLALGSIGEGGGGSNRCGEALNHRRPPFVR
nr:MAG TPA: hypothetical protein [Caudoviricetes sp.]